MTGRNRPRLPSDQAFIYFPGIPLDFYLPGINELISGAYKAGIAQVLLALTNAVLATSLLASDLFKEKISNKKLSVTIGGFPMCHGAGGMAAHYRFGARTGGSDIMIGLLFVAISFMATLFTWGWRSAPAEP